MLKRLVLAALLAAGVIAAWFLWLDPYFWDKGGGAEHDTAAPAKTPVPGAANATLAENDSGLSLSLKSIDLFQGEGGFEVWRLKAEWASMQKKGGKIFVEKPKLVYLMPPDNRELFVTADKGDIDQQEQILRFIDNVFAYQGNNTLRGPLLVYNGTAKTMTFPDGGEFSGKGSSGSAPFVIWSMHSNTVEASGGVTVHFEGTPELFPNEEAGEPRAAPAVP